VDHFFFPLSQHDGYFRGLFKSRLHTINMNYRVTVLSYIEFMNELEIVQPKNTK